MDRLRKRPLSEILRIEEYYNLFYEEFQKEEWLDVTVLLHSECCVDDIIEDGSVPKSVMLRIAERLDELDKKESK